MTPVRAAAAGATRTCPHCRATILESAAVCPACKHHLRASAVDERRALTTHTALKVEGTIRHPWSAEPHEYSVVVTVRDERGTVVTRQVVGVGAMQADDVRSFSLDVEVYAPK